MKNIASKNNLAFRGVIRISTQPRQKYKILTGRKNRFIFTLLISHKRLFHSGIAKKLLRFGYFNTNFVANFINLSSFSLRVEKIIHWSRLVFSMCPHQNHCFFHCYKIQGFFSTLSHHTVILEYFNIKE